MDSFEKINTQKETAPWLNTAAFNVAYTYSYISRAAFYGMIGPQYTSFMTRMVQHWLWWYDGYVPYFHNAEMGIPSTRTGTSLVNKVAKKVVGGRVMFKNAGKDSTKNKLNKALEYISTDWALKSGFESTVKKAVKYAAAAGTSLVKLNKADDKLWVEALRFDSFLPTVGARGELLEVKCFLRHYTNLGGKNPEHGERFQGYYVVEYRHFADYIKADGTVLHNVPVVEYAIHQQCGSINNGEYISQDMARKIPFSDLPKAMRKTIGRAYPDILFDKPVLLPFPDHLGCELVKWTDGVSELPELPFGESFLSQIITQLMSWDYYYAASNTDMYIGRGRIIAPKQIQGKGAGQGYNTGLDSFLFTAWQTSDPDAQKPIPIQFDLRSQSWTDIRNRLIQDISINTGVNISTIASFLQDNTAARTAREVSTEENETAEYVNDQRAIVEKPLNSILNLVTKYYGYDDTVVIRWSSAGLTNRFTLAEIIATGLREGFISLRKAVQMFNYDDDDAQVQEEYETIVKEREETDSMNDAPPFPFGGGDVNGSGDYTAFADGDTNAGAATDTTDG